MVEDALHLHATSRVGDAQGATGNQTFCGGGPVSGPHQAPVRLVMGPLQNLHGLAAADGQLGAVAGREVVDHHCQLAAAGELGAERGHVSEPGHELYFPFLRGGNTSGGHLRGRSPGPRSPTPPGIT